MAFDKANGAELLRIYWYDGAGFKGPTSEQTSLALLDNVKLRLGLISQAGEQQRVSSLIAADLIELARLRSICDAVLLTGDEEVTTGVRIAQSYGIRVHLIGIEPSRASQSRLLLQEVDTITEWTPRTIEHILSVRPSATVTATLGPSVAPVSISVAPDLDPRIEKVAFDLVATMDETEIKAVYSFLETAHGVPPEFDGKLLGLCRAELGRDLTIQERRHARGRFSAVVRTRWKAT